MKRLYEVATGGYGESFVRCYIWCDSAGEAVSLFRAKHPNEDANRIQLHVCFSEHCDAFCTDLDDAGWPTDVTIEPTKIPPLDVL